MTSKHWPPTAADWLTERADFLHIHVEPSASGSGRDVVMRIDGTYSEKPDAEAVAAALRRKLRWPDVPRQGMRWWDGPPRTVVR